MAGKASHADCKACSGTGKSKQAPKFTQLESTNGGLMALGDDGRVYVYCANPRRGWKALSNNQLENNE